MDINMNLFQQFTKFLITSLVRISKYKNIFGKGYPTNKSEEIFVIKKVKNTVLWTYVISDLIGEKIIGMFYEKELQKKSNRIQSWKSNQEEKVNNFI